MAWEGIWQATVGDVIDGQYSANRSRSDRIAESSPHTMREDRVILESIVAQNRDAILDLHNLMNLAENPHQVSAIPDDPSKAGEHHRKLSESTGIDTIIIPDVLPPSEKDISTGDGALDPSDSASSLRHTFSKRGVRLGVYMSILDLGAHEAPESLKKKWIREADKRHRSVLGDRYLPSQSHPERHNLPAYHELSTISEVDSASPAASGSMPATSVQAESMPLSKFSEISMSDASTPASQLSAPPNTPSEHPAADGDATRCSSKIKRVVKKMSISGLRSSPLIRESMNTT